MSTVKAEIEAKVTALKAEVAELETHLAAGGSWLDQEVSVVEAFVKNIIARILPQKPDVPPAA